MNEPTWKAVPAPQASSRNPKAVVARLFAPDDFSSALERQGVGDAGVDFARKLEQLSAVLASQDEGTSGRKTVMDQGAGEPAAGEAQPTEVGTEAG